jgi:hypothetical protein
VIVIDAVHAKRAGEMHLAPTNAGGRGSVAAQPLDITQNDIVSAYLDALDSCNSTR